MYDQFASDTNKTTLRKQMRNLRKAMTKQEVKRLSKLCINNLISLPIYQEADTICIYMHIENEVETNEIILDAKKRQKRIAAPKILGEDIEFYYIKETFQKGAYGILEPESKEVLTDSEGLIIIPGLVFDKNKNRIGYGGGYYDRYFIKHTEHKRVALAYDFQIVEYIDEETFDIRPDIIVTNKRIIQ